MNQTPPTYSELIKGDIRNFQNCENAVIFDIKGVLQKEIVDGRLLIGLSFSKNLLYN